MSWLWPANLGAESLRVHAGLEAGHAISGHQKRELGWGGDLYGALELPFGPEWGAEVELGGAWFAEGKAPRDPTLAPIGNAWAVWTAVGLQVRPFARAYGGNALGPAGLWVSGGIGATMTGGAARPLGELRLGWDVLLREAKLGVGPAVSYLYVWQPDDQLRPADANVLLFGVHAVFDTTPGRSLVDGDRDGDGIRDSMDRCPDVPEDKDRFQDEDGCPDLDNDQDGIQDSGDRCPDVPEDKDGFQDDDGCPDLDNDSDGIPDARDKCPNEAEDKDGFQDDDGCPDKDNDDDGIVDLEDLCPNEPESKNGYADTDGCPDEEQVRVVGDKIVLDDRVHFATNNARIRPLSHPLLGRLAKLIREHPEYVHVHIEGHADTRGEERFNQWLSEERAKSVLRFLVEHGVAETRLSSQGFGAKRPLVDSRSERAWFLNRRVEFKVTRELPAAPGAPATPGAGGSAAGPPATGAPAPTAPAPTSETPPPPPPPPGQGEVEEPGEKEEP